MGAPSAEAATICLTVMFPTLGLFQRLPCPDRPACKRPNCLFSHDTNTPHPPAVRIPLEVPHASSSNGPSSSVASSSSPAQSSSSELQTPRKPSLTKRATNSPFSAAGSSDAVAGLREPPRKLQRVGPAQKPVAVPTATSTSNGVPILRVNAAQSVVPIPVRQAMVKKLYEHFIVLYENILQRNPSIAAEHALKQEEEVYNNSTKLTYRNAVISSISVLKNRPKPDSVSHPSVGTNAEIAKREEDKKKLESLRLTTTHLEPYIMTLEQMETWGYITQIPEGEGGSRPSEEGYVQTCERCAEPFMVKRKEEADECVFHWGRKFATRQNGERIQTWTCCSKAYGEAGCTRGPHVFYESKPELLHQRHGFSHTREVADDPSGADTALDVVALDCEMIYTTGGMRVARVSVVDSAGQEIYDELVRMDEGVEPIDFNTRFSGITEEGYATAVLTLASIRKSLDTLINANTIIIGHALDNDLKTLRMIHHRCVDTAIMFPHKAGPPYRRSLRDLAKEHLGKTIQVGGGSTGHSSVEDSAATLDLVRWHVLHGPKPKPKPKPPAPEPAAETSSAVTTTPSPQKLVVDNSW